MTSRIGHGGALLYKLNAVQAVAGGARGTPPWRHKSSPGWREPPKSNQTSAPPPIGPPLAHGIDGKWILGLGGGNTVCGWQASYWPLLPRLAAVRNPPSHMHTPTTGPKWRGICFAQWEATLESKEKRGQGRQRVGYRKVGTNQIQTTSGKQSYSGYPLIRERVADYRNVSCVWVTLTCGIIDEHTNVKLGEGKTTPSSWKESSGGKGEIGEHY